MKIQCNNCTKTYLVSSEQIGESGRKVKCTSCNHTWHEYLQESTVVSIQEKKAGGLVFTTLVFAVVTGLCVIVANPREANKVYKTISAYKDSISYKLGYKKKQTNSPNIKRLTANKFYQDYLFLSNLKSS
ncbi:MAG: zinc-ribbon domain-containing protein [Wolbachia sp.]